MARVWKIAVAVGVAAMIGGFGVDASAATRGQQQAVKSTGRVWALVRAGAQHACGIRLDHTLWCWGNNRSGQLGIGDTKDRHRPTQVGAAANWAQVELGTAHTCGIRFNHSLWCWGNGTYGGLGVGDTSNRLSPTRVGRDGGWVHVQAGYADTCATRLDHTLWCWGDNEVGQLGLGDTTDRLTPAQVGIDTDWTTVAVGGFHTCATRADHTLWCWGYNNDGQLGLGDQGEGTDRHTPAQVGAGASWARVSLGGYHSCATQLDHTLWCWGVNTQGQLGLGDTSNRSIPTQVGSGATWARAKAGGAYGHTCATKLDHTLWCWGSNQHGQLGLGDTTDRHSPTQVGADTTWARVAPAAAEFTCGTRRDHTLWCWGDNESGQVGVGDIRDRWVPTRV